MRMNLLRRIGAGVVLAAISVTTLAQSKGLNLSDMDNSANACDNFYQLANGGWLKKTRSMRRKKINRDGQDEQDKSRRN
jgi:putative endopeptidase